MTPHKFSPGTPVDPAELWGEWLAKTPKKYRTPQSAMAFAVDRLAALPVPDATAGRELADRVLADPKVIWLRECGFQSAARFESELRAAINRALALPPAHRNTPTTQTTNQGE